jgi:pimeloyl-ACP methyl ester carboxylesterase
VDLTREAFAVDSSVPLRQYPGPRFTIVTPRNDTPLSLHRAVPEVKHVVIMGTGHWIHLDKPEVFNDALNKMLKAVI